MHIELLGGLGDCLNRLYSIDWMPKLLEVPAGEMVDVTIISHNPFVDELFKWHPKRSQLNIRKIKFHYPWDDKEWRKKNDLPDSPQLDYAPQDRIEYFPPLHEYPLIDKLSEKKFLIFVISAGTQERHIPEFTRERMATWAISMGYQIYVIGRRYQHFEEFGASPRHVEDFMEPRDGVRHLIDGLTLPGTAKLMERCAGVVTTHTSMCLLSWFLKKPTFLLYGDHVRDVLLPLGNVGYMAGNGRPGNDSMHFNEFNELRFTTWLKERG